MKVSEKNSFNKKQLLLPCYYWKCSIESTKKWMRVMTYEGEWIKKYGMSRIIQKLHSIERKKTALTLLLPTVLDLIIKTTNDSDEAWRLLHQKYGMSRIIRKFHSTKKTTALTSLLPTVFYWIYETMNESDEVWRWVHRKYEMSLIVWKLRYG